MNPSELFFYNDMDNKNKFGYWLKITREEYGYSVRGLAKALQISPSYISDIENGHKPAPFKHLNQIQKIFNIPEKEIPYLHDLAGSSKGSWDDLNEYLTSHQNTPSIPYM